MNYRQLEAEYERNRDRAGETCEPKVIKAVRAYEPDGYSMEYTYNCENCNITECEFWAEHN